MNILAKFLLRARDENVLVRARAARASYALEFQAVAVAPEFEGTAASERPCKYVAAATRRRGSR